MIKLSRQNLRKGIISIVLFCFLIDPIVLQAQIPADRAEGAASLSEFSMYGLNAPELVPDEGDPNLVHVFLPSLAVGADIPNPVDFVYDHGVLVALQSPDGTVRRDISRTVVKIQQLGSTNLENVTTTVDVVQALGPVIEEFIEAVLETAGQSGNPTIAVHATRVARNPASQPKVNANPKAVRLKVKKQGAQSAATNPQPVVANQTDGQAKPVQQPQLTRDQVIDQGLNKTAEVVQKTWGLGRRIGKVIKVVGKWTAALSIDAVAITLSTITVEQFISLGLTGFFTTHPKTIWDLAFHIALDVTAVWATKKLLRKKPGQISQDIAAKIKDSGDDNKPVEEVAPPGIQKAMRKSRGKQCVADVKQA